MIYFQSIMDSESQFITVQSIFFEIGAYELSMMGSSTSMERWRIWFLMELATIGKSYIAKRAFLLEEL